MTLFKTVADKNGGKQVAMTAEEEAAFLAMQAANAAAAPRQDIISQISALEATVTPRRMREATLGIDGGFLSDLNNKISALRSKL